MRKLALLLVLPLLIAGCQSTASNVNLAASNAQLGAAASIRGAAAVVSTCILDKASPEGVKAGVAITSTVAIFDDMNAAVQSGAGSIAVAVASAKAALNQVDAILAAFAKSATPEQMKALTPPKSAAPKGANYAEIVGLIQTFMPIILSSGTIIADLIKSFVDNTQGPEVTLAMVQESNGKLHAALDAWNAAVCVQ